MPRAPRLVLSGQVHHIVQRGDNRPAIFFDDAEDYVLACYRYIEANPLIVGHQTYRALGRSGDARREAYREIFAEGLDDGLLATLRDATQRGWVPSSDRFRRGIETALGRPVGPPVRGRPRKTARQARLADEGQLRLL